MADDDGLIRIGVSVNISDLSSGLSDAQDALESFADTGADAFGSLSSAAEESAQTIEDAYAQMDGAAQQVIETLNQIIEAREEEAAAAQEAASQAADAAEQELATVSAREAAYRQLAEAQFQANQANAARSQGYRELNQIGENPQAIAIMAQYERDAAEAAEQLALAKRNLADVNAFESAAEGGETEIIQANTAAMVENAEAANADAEATERAGISARMAGTAGIGLMEGRLLSANRAASAFAATTLGLGPILEAAFPIIGAIALLDVFFQIGSEIADVVSGLIEMRDQMEDLGKAAQKSAETITELETKTNELNHQAIIKADPVRGYSDALDQANTNLTALQANAAKAKASLDSLTQEQTNLGPYQIKQLNIDVVAAQQNYDVAKAKVEEAAAEQQKAQQELANAQQKADDKQLEENKRTQSELTRQQREAAEERLNAYRDEFEQLNAVSKMSPGQSASFWGNAMQSFAPGTSEYKTTQTEMVRAIEQAHQQLTEAIKKASEERMAAERGETEQLQRQDQEIRKMQEDAAKGLQRNQIAGAESLHGELSTGLTQREAQIQQNAAVGGLDPIKALEQLRDLHQQMIAEDERFIEEEMAIYGKGSSEYKALESKLEEEHRKSVQQQLQDTTKILQEEEQRYKQAFEVMTNAFNRAVEQWETREKTAQQAFAQMLTQMEMGLETLVLKYLEGQLMKELEKLLKSLLSIGSTASTSSTTPGQQTLTAAQTQNPMIVESYSAAAAAESFLTSGGDAAAAAATYAQGMAYFPLAAFEMGGVVEGSRGAAVPILAHAGERVLSVSQTHNFESMVNGKVGGASQNVNLHYNPQVSAYDRSGMSSTLQAHKDDILSIVRNGYNSGALR